MAFATIRQEKVKGNESFNSRNSHNNRKIITKNIDTNLTHKNIIIQDIKYKNFDEFCEIKKSEIKNHNEKFGTKNRWLRKTLNKKNGNMELSSLSQEFVISSSPDFLSEKESIEYLKKADLFLRKWFPDCEVLQSVIHLDETTPHLHFHISYFDQNNKKFIQKTMSQVGLTDINKIRNAFQEEVASGFGLQKQDGSVVSKEKHTNKASLEIMSLKKELSEAREAILEQTEVNRMLKQDITVLEQSMDVLEAKNRANFGMNVNIKKELSEVIGELNSTRIALHKARSANEPGVKDILNGINRKDTVSLEDYNQLARKYDALRNQNKQKVTSSENHRSISKQR